MLGQMDVNDTRVQGKFMLSAENETVVGVTQLLYIGELIHTKKYLLIV